GRGAGARRLCRQGARTAGNRRGGVSAERRRVPRRPLRTLSVTRPRIAPPRTQILVGGGGGGESRAARRRANLRRGWPRGGKKDLGGLGGQVGGRERAARVDQG